MIGFWRQSYEESLLLFPVDDDSGLLEFSYDRLVKAILADTHFARDKDDCWQRARLHWEAHSTIRFISKIHFKWMDEKCDLHITVSYTPPPSVLICNFALAHDP